MLSLWSTRLFTAAIIYIYYDVDLNKYFLYYAIIFKNNCELVFTDYPLIFSALAADEVFIFE